MTKRTPLYAEHEAAGGKLVDFAGWELPVNYGSQIDEHVAVRTAVGMFDVSHMTIIDITGADALPFLRKVVANDVGKLEVSRALYGALLSPSGGVLDDLIVYRLESAYRCVVNGATREKILAWFAEQALPDMQFAEQDEAMIAVQGPEAIATLATVASLPNLSDLDPFQCLHHHPNQGASQSERGRWLIARTGYTGEDGVEVMLPSDAAAGLWRQLRGAGVTPAGLGARDTLRLEAGLNLYGQDLDEAHSPLASNIGWTIAWDPQDRDFIGRHAIEPERGACPQKLVGIVLQDKGVLRHDQRVVTDAGDGIITSGTYSPTLEYSIGLARVPKAAVGECTVDIRGKLKSARIVKPTFVRNGQSLLS